MFRDGSLRWSGPSGMLGVIWEMGLDGPTQIDHVLGAPGGVQHGEEAHPLVVIDHALVPTFISTWIPVEPLVFSAITAHASNLLGTL